MDAARELAADLEATTRAAAEPTEPQQRVAELARALQELLAGITIAERELAAERERARSQVERAERLAGEIATMREQLAAADPTRTAALERNAAAAAKRIADAEARAASLADSRATLLAYLDESDRAGTPLDPAHVRDLLGIVK